MTIPVGVDPHLAFVRGDVVPRTPQGCEECLRIGSPWVHLRLCLTCGHVGQQLLDAVALLGSRRPGGHTGASSTKHHRQSSPGSNERTIGCWVAW